MIMNYFPAQIDNMHKGIFDDDKQQAVSCTKTLKKLQNFIYILISVLHELWYDLFEICKYFYFMLSCSIEASIETKEALLRRVFSTFNYFHLFIFRFFCPLDTFI